MTDLLANLRTPGKPKCVYADLRIIGPNFSPADITNRLGLNPSSAEEIGHLLPYSDEPSPNAYWFLSTANDSSISLEHHLQVLINLLAPKTEILQALADEGHNLSISAYILTSHENVESHISHKTLRTLSQLPCKLWTDTYFDLSDEDIDDIDNGTELAATAPDTEVPTSTATQLRCEPARVWLFLDISHESLEPEQVTNLLGLEPTRWFRKGEVVLPSRLVSQEGLWSLIAILPDSESDINIHLHRLLDKFAGKEKLLKSLQDKGYSLRVTCKIGIARWSTSCQLYSESVQRLAALKLPILFDFFDEHNVRNVDPDLMAWQ